MKVPIWGFRVLWWRFAKFFMSFSKPQVKFSSNFASTLVSWNITPLYLFSSSIIYFGLKQPIKVPIFETFKFSSRNMSNSLCQFWNNKSVPFQIFHHSSVSLHINPLWIFSFHETLLLCTFLGQMLYTLQKRDQPKCKFFRLFSGRIKLLQILVIFETKIHFFFKFFTTLQYHET